VLALLVFGAALALYHAGMAPGLLWGDSAEMQILAGIGGIAHPTGYPLFILVGLAFTHLTGLSPATAANLVSGVFAAATLALLVTFLDPPRGECTRRRRWSRGMGPVVHVLVDRAARRGLLARHVRGGRGAVVHAARARARSPHDASARGLPAGADAHPRTCRSVPR
jgi:hypothetical protein